MLTLFDLIQLWQVDSYSSAVELEQIGLRMLLAFCANGVLDVCSFPAECIRINCVVIKDLSGIFLSFFSLVMTQN